MPEPEKPDKKWWKAISFFGEFSWNPPSWFVHFKEDGPRRASELLERARARLNEDPAWTKRWGVGMAALLVLSLGGIHWYRTRPRPVRFTLTASAPGPTKLADVSAPDPVHLTFSGPSARLSDIGKPAQRGIVLSPSLLGTWRWDSDSQLTFTPKADWAVGQEYAVRLERTLFPDHVRLQRYSTNFKSAPFTAKITASEFYQDPRDPKIKKAAWTVQFSHPVDPADFGKRVSLFIAGERGGGFLGLGKSATPFTVAYDRFKGQAYIQSETISIPPNDTAITLAVEPGARSSRGGPSFDEKLESKVAVPGIYNFFRVVDAAATLPRNERYEPEQALVLNLSAGAAEAEIKNNFKAWLLPRDRPETPGQPAVRNEHWVDPARIGPEVLSASEALPLKALPTDREYAVLHAFRFDAEPGRSLYVRLAKGTRSHGGYMLAKDFDAVIRVPDFPKELNIMADGALLSLSGDKKLSIISRGISAIRFQLGRVVSGQINHLVSQAAGQFKSPEFQNYNFNQDNITERFEEVRELTRLSPGKTQYSSLDMEPYLAADGAPRGLFFLKVQAWDPLTKKPIGIEDARLILVTDMGLVVKDAKDGSHEVFIQSIHDGEPVSGVSVSVLGKNGLPALTAATDAQGRASFPPLESFDHEKKPVVYVARHGRDFSFIPYDWGDRRLDFSRFDVGGEPGASAGEGSLTAFMFSDRGVYRPGEEFRVGLIIKAADWTRGLSGVPLEIAVTDARGLEVMKRKLSLSAAGLEEIRYKTEETSPTGRYEVRAYVVKDGRRDALLGAAGVRVEEFLPDRMKISTRLSGAREQGWISPKEIEGQVTLRTLFGIPAENRRVAARISLAPAPAAFASFPDHIFFDPQRAKNSFHESLPDQTTNDKGEVAFPLRLDRFEKATYRLTFSAEGYEAAGGRSVGSESAVVVSDRPWLIGYKPDGDLKYVSKDSERSVELIAVDPRLQKATVSDLTATILEQRYLSVLQRQENGTYKYESVLKETAVEKKRISIAAGGLRFALPTKNPGDFVLVLKDASDTELCRAAFSVTGTANITRSLEKNAELQLRLDKADYAPGEDIELQIRAPYTGAGLITIERDRVYAARWFKTSTTNSVQRIRIPAGLEGNAYVNVAFVRASDSKDIFMSPLSYGVAPFSLSRERRTNRITLAVPERARPGEPFRIRHASAKPGKIVVFAVDEGILQVAAYKTPDPLSLFFAKKALEVRTLQILDLILPEFKFLQALSAPGGDEGASALGQNLNPFKRRRDPPVAYWSGIVETGPEARELVYDIPDHFNGTLRVMAITVSPDSIGAAERKAIVRAHYTISPNAPTFAAPGDEFNVSVSVANNVEGSGKDAGVSLTLAASEHVQLLDPGPRELRISEGKEATATFRMKAVERLGSANLVFVAANGKKSSKAAVDMSIRPAIVYRTTAVTGHFRGGKAEAKAARRIRPEYRILEAAASTVPLSLAHGLARYLQKFPYGCTEQLVSQAWPALVLRSRPEFGYSADKVQTNFESVLHILRSRQNAEGAFGFWAANSHVSDFQTVYAAHYLTEAKQKGFPVPNDMLSRALVYLRGLAGAQGGALAEERVRAYAAYVLTQNGLLTTEYVGAIRSRLEREPGQAWRKDITAGYLAACYKLMQAGGKADALIEDMKLGQPQEADYDNFYDDLARDSQLLYLLARHFPERLRRLRAEDLLHIAGPVAKGSYNTLSSAYTILALGAYADAVGTPERLGVGVVELLAGSKPRPLPLPGGLFPKVPFSNEAVGVRFTAKDRDLVFYQMTQAGFDTALPTAEVKSRLEVHREYRDDSGRTATETFLGSELEVRLKLRTVEGGGLRNVAIVDLLPGGFEPVLDSVRRPAAAAPRGPVECGEGCGEDGEMEAVPSAPAALQAGWTPEYVDIREDRVVVFGAVGPSSEEFIYKIKATNQGAFVIPPPFGESMYDRSVQAQGLPGRMTVK